MAGSEHKKEVGDRLLLTIQAVGRTQAEIARAFDVSPSKLGNWIRGENYPDPRFLLAFCERYAVTMDWLYRGRVSSAMDAPLADALWAASQEKPAE
jgi:transcriptional regulator with XRE-family HTH domain